MPAHPKVRYTYEDYLSIPEDTSHRYEIIDGELYVWGVPRIRHQQVVVSLTRLLSTIAIGERLGEVVIGPITVRLADEIVMVPDVAFVSSGHLGLIDEIGIMGPPDLVVEVLSPSNRGYDRSLKRKRYMASEVPELWIVDADEDTLEVWRPGLEEPERPVGAIEWRVGERRFEIALADIFRR